MSALTDHLNYVQLLPPVADAFDTTKTTSYINMKDYKSALFVLYWGVGATGTQTVTVLQATDSSGTGATAIPFNYRRVTDTTVSDVPGARTAAAAAGFTTTAGSNQMYLIEVDAVSLDVVAGGSFVALVTLEVVNSPVLGGIGAIMGEPRYAGATPKTALS